MIYSRYLVLLVLFQFIAFPAFACSRLPGTPEPSIRELFQKAKAVFVAHVWRTEEKSQAIDRSGKLFELVEGNFRVTEKLKGEPPENGTVKTFVFGPGNCSLPLFAGFDYVFFIQEEHELILWPDGSRPILNLEATNSIKFLEELRQLIPEGSRQ